MKEINYPPGYPKPIDFPTIPYGESTVFTPLIHEMKKEGNQKRRKEKRKKMPKGIVERINNSKRKVKVLTSSVSTVEKI